MSENDDDDSQIATPAATGVDTLFVVGDRPWGSRLHGLRSLVLARGTERKAKTMQVERIRVLLVEDDPLQAGVIKATLASTPGLNFQLKIADRLSTAFKQLTAGEIDIVLLDLSLPDSDGLDTFLNVRQAAPAIPIIVFTGIDDERLASETMARGAQDYLVKGTVDAQWLVRSIRYSIYRIHSEQALNEQRRRHRLLMESIPDVRIYFKDEAGLFLEVNHALAKVYGFDDPQRLVGLSDYDLFTKEHADRAARDEHEVIRTGEPIIGKMEKETLRDGRISWALTTKMPFQQENGGAMGIFGISRDITDLKETDEELRIAVDNLTRSHKELKETQLMLIQAEKLQSLGQMAASVAHEIKNPLAILHMGIECLTEFFFQGNEKVNEIVGEMKDALHRADAVIRGMLDYSSARDLETSDVCVNSLITQTLRFVRHEIAKAKVRVVTHFAEGLATCRLDAQKIEQVFVNLFVNACHALPAGGVLTITTSEKIVEFDDPQAERDEAESVRFRRGDKIAIVEIRDNGPGIPEDKLDRIFDPFYTTKTSGNGTGLGLSVVKKIIDLHEGRISIANADGGGAQVMIALKCISEPRCSVARGGN
jgi:PAS domain S-box-containing protein